MIIAYSDSKSVAYYAAAAVCERCAGARLYSLKSRCPNGNGRRCGELARLFPTTTWRPCHRLIRRHECALALRNRAKVCKIISSILDRAYIVKFWGWIRTYTSMCDLCHLCDLCHRPLALFGPPRRVNDESLPYNLSRLGPAAPHRIASHRFVYTRARVRGYTRAAIISLYIYTRVSCD